jgi:hypothetical protein
VPVSEAVRNNKLNMDLNDIIKQENTQRKKNEPRSPTKRGIASSPTMTKKIIEKPKRRDGNNRGKNRSWNIDVPESALKAILEGAGVNVPDGVTLKLVARKKGRE